VPVYGQGVFDIMYCRNHQRELERVYEMLADETSRRAFECVLRYKLTGDINYLMQCQTRPGEAYENILRLGANEAYMDLGAYNGDTVNEFLHYSGGSYDRIVAVEPDKRNFKKLSAATQGLERCRCINAAVDSEYSTGGFAMRGGRNSSVSGTGDPIVLDSVDNMACGRITYIKMDVEGQEKQAIAGAELTIRRFRPKMLVSAYHRNEDMFFLPLQIKEIMPDYTVYFRHYPYIPAWDTNFYFI
jgi:FkbM family methyltransferase